MRIGLFVAYWPWFSPEQQMALAHQADRAGLDSVPARASTWRSFRSASSIYLGSMGPKAIEQTARIADGWLPSTFTPERAPELLTPFEASCPPGC